MKKFIHGQARCGDALITFTDVTKSYPDGTVAVDNLSLEVPAGKIAVLAGPRGRGQTNTHRRFLLMDEPFSAVDPVVRKTLQAELVRLQDQLHKTIVFVTHDIDEAIRLGDLVCVLKVGGRIGQYDTPANLLAAPADEFVAQ